MTMAGPNFYRGQYEFQCLHGMGEPLYEEVVGRDKLDRPCRVYAPVGSHETLLAYLVRRLLENGANTSFVNRIADASVPVDELIADPVALALQRSSRLGAPHEKIALPRDLYGSRARRIRAGVDFSNEQRLAELARSAAKRARGRTGARSRRAPRRTRRASRCAIRPITPTSSAMRATPAPTTIAAAIGGRGRGARRPGRAVPPNERAAILRRAADALEAANDDLVGLIVREAGKSYANAVAEVREAVDFLRYYAAEATRTLSPGSPARSASSPASARGIFRWRSSPARSPRRSPPAMRSSPSRPRRRR